MTEQEQRIAIGRQCGWTLWPIVGWTPPDTKPPFTVGGYPPLPDYLHDLNAMNEAEKTLDEGRQYVYCEQLAGLAHRGNQFLFRLANATAAQRAEAFLRTIGKWKE